MASSAPSTPHLIEFPPFQLDLRGGMLRRATTPVALRPKTFAVLQYLAEHPGDLVTKQALLDSIWGDVAVTEDVVRLSIRELRVALADDPTTPRFIQTVPRRGYRFIAAMGAASVSVLVPTAAPPSGGASWPGVVVGRASELAEIADAFRGAANGRRQVVFVSGEAGIGNTTLRKGLCRQMLLGGLSAAETRRATSALAFPAPSCRRTCCRCWSIAATGRDRVAARRRARRDLLRGQRSVLTRALSSASDGAAVLGGGGDCLLPSAYCCRLRRPSG